MAIVQHQLFSWQDVEASSEILRFRRVMEILDDRRLIETLERSVLCMATSGRPLARQVSSEQAIEHQGALHGIRLGEQRGPLRVVEGQQGGGTVGDHPRGREVGTAAGDYTVGCDIAIALDSHFDVSHALAFNELEVVGCGRGHLNGQDIIVVIRIGIRPETNHLDIGWLKEVADLKRGRRGRIVGPDADTSCRADQELIGSGGREVRV